MKLEDLWIIPDPEESIRTPTVTLKEIAYQLSRKTNRVLSGRVGRTSIPRADLIVITLYVEAPALRNYSVEVLKVSHALFDAYPSHVESSINDLENQVNSEDELYDVVEKIIQSEEMIKILRALLNESQSATSQWISIRDVEQQVRAGPRGFSMSSECHSSHDPEVLNTPPIGSVGRAVADTVVIVELSKSLCQDMPLVEIKAVLENLTLEPTATINT